MADQAGLGAGGYADEWAFIFERLPKTHCATGTSIFAEDSDCDVKLPVDGPEPFGHSRTGDRAKEDENWDHDSLKGDFLYDPELDHKNTGPPTKARYATSIPYLISTYRRIEASRPGYALTHVRGPNHWQPNRVERVIEYESLPSKSEGPITCHLGDLSCLPQEVLKSILDNCTIQSLLHLRGVNRLAEVTVHSLPVWKTLAYRLPYLLQTMRSPLTPIARYITAVDLLRKLVQVECDQCGFPGDRMNLLTLERFCRFCEKNHRFQIFKVSDAMTAWGLPESEKTAILELPYVDTAQTPLNTVTTPEGDIFVQDLRFPRLVAGAHVHEVALLHYGDGAIGKIKAVWAQQSGVHRLLEADSIWFPCTLRESLLPPSWMERWPDTIQTKVINKLRPRVPWLLGNINAVTPGAPRLDWGFRCFACEKLMQEVGRRLGTRTVEQMERLFAFAPLAGLQATDPWHYRLYNDEAFKKHVRSWGGLNAINTAGFHKHHDFFPEERQDQRRRRKNINKEDLIKKFHDPRTWHLDEKTWKGTGPRLRSLKSFDIE